MGPILLHLFLLLGGTQAEQANPVSASPTYAALRFHCDDLAGCNGAVFSRGTQGHGLGHPSVPAVGAGAAEVALAIPVALLGSSSLRVSPTTLPHGAGIRASVDF